MPGADRLVPTYLIKLNNQRMQPEMSADLQSIVIEEHLNCPAMFLLTFSRNQRCWCGHKDLSMGSSVNIELGYLNSTKQVMDGEITGDGAEYSSFEPAYTTVKGYDRLHRLARRHMTRTFKGMKDWQIAQQIAEEIHLAADIRDKAGEIHEYVMQNGLQDLAFLHERAKRAGREIGVTGKKLYWRKPADELEPVAVLEYGKSLREFSVNVTGMGEKSEVIVRGLDPRTQQAIVWREESKADMPFGRAREVVIDNSIKSVAEAENLAKAVLREKQLEYMNAQGSCLGNPDMHVGQTLQIKGVGDKVGGKYYIVWVEHELNGQEGYITRFKLKKPKPPSDKKKNKLASDNSDAANAATSSTIASAASNEELKPSLTNPQWSQAEVKRGDKLKLTAATQNIPENTEIAFMVNFKAKAGQQEQVLRLPAKVKNSKLEADWKFTQHPEGDLAPEGRYPTYLFEVEYQDQKAKSGDLLFKEPINIFVLVPGTTDPGNVDENSRSQSYNTDPGAGLILTRPDGVTEDPEIKDSYWKESGGLIDKLQELKQEYYDLHICRDFGWSGDNSKKEREKAGKKLAVFLKKYYSGYTERDVSLHLIGHSHGGNVINEFTRAIAAESWPEFWKIKSITYLSTPFFRKNHHPDKGKFHGGYKVISIYNQYDLTQRVLADFSLHDLNGILTEIKNQGIDQKLERIISQDMPKVIAELKEAFIGTGAGVLVKSASPTGIFIVLSEAMFLGLQLYNGRDLYEAGVRLFKDLRELLEITRRAIGIISRYKTASKNRLISINLQERIETQLDDLTDALDTTIQSFSARIKSDHYQVGYFFEDLHITDITRLLLLLIKIHPVVLNGQLMDIIHDLVHDQIDVFDDTLNSPRQIITQEKLMEIDISTLDPYSGQKDYFFRKFIQRMEKWEEAYATGQNSSDLLNMLLVLLVQNDYVSAQLPLILDKIMKTIKSILDAWIIPGQIGSPAEQFKAQLKELYEILWDWWTIIDQRKFHLVVENDRTSPKRGETMYLLKTSHNLSMSRFFEHKQSAEYQKYFENLEKQIDTPKKKDIEK